jgi:hypothetical protein
MLCTQQRSSAAVAFAHVLSCQHHAVQLLVNAITLAGRVLLLITLLLLSAAAAQVPIMLKSMLCSLQNTSDTDLMALGECPFDQVGPTGCACYISSLHCYVSLLQKETQWPHRYVSVLQILLKQMFHCI